MMPNNALQVANEWLVFAYLLGLLWLFGMSMAIFGELLLEASGRAA
jgi:hypothetical protein